MQSDLGVLYLIGQGVQQDYKAALKWFRKGADQGAANAQFYVGIMYGSGLGMPPDYNEATTWYRKAANQGHVVAQFLLGRLYYNGDRVQQN